MTGSPPAGRTQRVVLVRHGETAWSRSGQQTGRSDIPLDPEGVKQAERLPDRLRGWTFAEVLCSPLQRARRTCELAGYISAAHIDPDTQEWDYGSYEGRTAEQIRADRPGWTIWKDGVVGGETIDDVGRRADRVIERVRAVAGDVALFAHGHFLRILTARWCDLPVLTAERLALSPAAVSVLGYDRDDPVIWLWDDTSHLTATGGMVRDPASQAP
jgi:probable phosphoglycerate mutase